MVLLTTELSDPILKKMSDHYTLIDGFGKLTKKIKDEIIKFQPNLKNLGFGYLCIVTKIMASSWYPFLKTKSLNLKKPSNTEGTNQYLRPKIIILNQKQLIAGQETL